MIQLEMKNKLKLIALISTIVVIKEQKIKTICKQPYLVEPFILLEPRKAKTSNYSRFLKEENSLLEDLNSNLWPLTQKQR